MTQKWISYSTHFSIDGLISAFSYRSTFESNHDYDRNKFASLLGLDASKLVNPKQTHSSNIQLVNQSGILHDTDSIVALSKDFVLSIQVADCIPIFIVDFSTHATALIHAGWKGLVSQILPKTIHQLVKNGCAYQSLKVVLGPSIQPCCFEVRDDIISNFPKENIKQHPNLGGTYLVNLQQLAYSQLIQLGVKSDHILMDSQCSSCDDQLFFSYRRDGKMAGRMLGMLGWA